MTLFPYLWYGTVYESDASTPSVGTTIVLTNESSGEQLSAITNESGQYIFDLAGTPTDWANNDIINVVASGSGSNGKILKFKAFARGTTRISEGFKVDYTATET